MCVPRDEEAGSYILSLEFKRTCRKSNSKKLKILNVYLTDNWDVFLDDCMAAINSTINRFFMFYTSMINTCMMEKIASEKKFYNYIDYFQVQELCKII